MALRRQGGWNLGAAIFLIGIRAMAAIPEVQAAPFPHLCDSEDGLFCPEAMEGLLRFFGRTLPRVGVPPAPPCPDEPILLRLPPDFELNRADCTDFIAEDGSYGEFGEIIIDYLRSEQDGGSPFFRSTLPGMGAPPPGICPRWDLLSREEREKFWVWTLASLAWAESSCKPTARNPNGTNTVAVGLLQLEEPKSMRAWRGPACDVPSVLEPVHNLACGLDILRELLLGKQGVYQTSGALYPARSYWQAFYSRDGGRVGALISTYTPCWE